MPLPLVFTATLLLCFLVSSASSMPGALSRVNAHRRIGLRNKDHTFDINQVEQIAIAAASHSWELGTLTEALIELDSPALSVFKRGSIPPPTDEESIPDAVLNIARSVTNKESASSHSFVNGDGAAGDPASLGVAILLANTVENNDTWALDASKELNHLLYEVPRSSDGAISHRESEVQLWADSVYMVPPFLAYYGALEGGENGTALLREAYQQCKLYRAHLFDEDVSLWRHIVLGSFQLNQHWATGNGWAAMGMMRVLATIRASDSADQLQSEQDDLISWVDEILTGAYAFQGKNGTLYNYLDESHNKTFADSAGTALITAAAYRLARITGDASHLPAAERAYELVANSIGSDGRLLNAVDPLKFSAPLAANGTSPEGQSFVLMLYEARHAYRRSWH